MKPAFDRLCIELPDGRRLTLSKEEAQDLAGLLSTLFPSAPSPAIQQPTFPTQKALKPNLPFVLTKDKAISLSQTPSGVYLSIPLESCES